MTKTEMAAAYTVRTCDGCGISDEAAMESGVGFWVYEGGGSCGDCLAAEAES